MSAPAAEDDSGFASFGYRSADGLALQGRLYGALSAALPLVCLSGLSRNARDFHAFARALREIDPARPIVAFDYRGRGRSQWAQDPATYALAVEAGDIVAGLADLGIERAVFVGTSRGGLITPILAATHPRLVAGAVLNDAGPRLEIEGLLAIKAYVGKVPPVADWEAATDAVAAINAAEFPALGRADFARMARAIFKAGEDGLIRPDHDPRLETILGAITPDAPMPEMWELFDALARVPVLAIRGETSRLFSAATLDAMAARHPDFQALTVPGQGHPPLLETAGLPEVVAAFAWTVERSETMPGARPDR